MDSLSKRQQQIYNFIESYIEQKGFGPTVREISRGGEPLLPFHGPCAP